MCINSVLGDPLHTWAVTFEPTHNYLGTNCLNAGCLATWPKFLGIMTRVFYYCKHLKLEYIFTIKPLWR